MAQKKKKEARKTPIFYHDVGLFNIFIFIYPF